MYTSIIKCSLLIALTSPLFTSCEKDGDTIDTPPQGIDTAQIVSTIGGVRYWEGLGPLSGVKDTFEIQHSLNAIHFKGLTLYFKSLDTAGKLMLYSHNDNSGMVSNHYEVTFYYAKDSIIYFTAANTGVTGQSTTKFHTYPH